MCSHPVENVYWPLGRAPHGHYRVWVRAHRLQEGEAPVSARLLILRGDNVVADHRGTLASRSAVLGPFEFTYGDSLALVADKTPELAGPSGTWDCTTELPLGGLTHVLTLEPDLSGTLVVTEPTETSFSISSVHVAGELLTFVVTR